MHDLLVKNALVIDPSQNLSAIRHVAFRDGRVAGMFSDVPDGGAARVLDATGLIATPGLIDLHVHVYPGVSFLGIEPDRHCLERGVTTAVDAGSAGAQTFLGLRRYVLEVSQTRLFAFLNISSQGMLAAEVGELEDMRWVRPDRVVTIAREHRDVIVGIKIRLGRAFVHEENELVALRMARQTADALELPVMVHVGNTHHPLSDILSCLERGDIVTHSYTGSPHGILDDGGRLLEEVRHARRRGVRFDVGHGVGSFTFAVAERALQQDFPPGTISSDLHTLNVNGPVYDLATTLSKFLYLGMSLPDAIARATVNPAGVLGHAGQLGTLIPGAAGDLALWAVVDGDFTLRDAAGDTRRARQMLMPRAVVKGGRVVVEPHTTL